MSVFSCCIVDCKSKCECTIDDENWCPKEEYIKLDDIVFPDALRRPRTMMVVIFDANVTVSTMKGPLRHIESTFPAKST